MKTRPCLLMSALLFFLAATIAGAMEGYYQTASGQGLLQITNNAGYDLALATDPESQSLYLTSPGSGAIDLPDGNTVTLQMDAADWVVYGDVSDGIVVSVHPGFTTSLQLAQTAYGGNVGLIGIVDDGRHQRSGTLFNVASPPVVVQQTGPVIVDPGYSGYYYDPNFYYYDDGPRASAGSAIVGGIVAGVLESIFDRDRHHHDRHDRPPPGPPPRPPHGPPPGPRPGDRPHGGGRPPEPPHRPEPSRPQRPHEQSRPPRHAERQPSKPEEARPRQRPQAEPEQQSDPRDRRSHRGR